MENAKITMEKSLLLNFLNLHALYSMQCNKKIGFKQKITLSATICYVPRGQNEEIAQRQRKCHKTNCLT